MGGGSRLARVVAFLTRQAAVGIALCVPAVSAEMPLRAFLVGSEERSGCLVTQRVREDVTGRLRAGPVRLSQSQNPEDAATWNELFLYLDSARLGGPQGRLILRLGVEGDRPPEPGRLELGSCQAVRRGEGAVVELEASVAGTPRAGLYFAREHEVYEGRFSCPEAGMFEPVAGTFLRVYALQEHLGLERDSGGRYLAEIPEFLLAEARLLERGVSLLAVLDHAFASRGREAFLWDLTALRAERLGEIVEGFGRGEGLQCDALISVHRPAGAQSVRHGQADFLPQLRQRIGVLEPGGASYGGEVLIRCERPG